MATQASETSQRARDVLRLNPKQSSIVHSDYTADCVCCMRQRSHGICSLTLNDGGFVAILLVFLGTVFSACFSVGAKELIEAGYVWSQNYFLSQIIVLILLIILHFILLFYHYYKRDQCWLENGLKYVSADRTTRHTIFGNYYSYIFYIFADKDEEEIWKIMIFRGIMFSGNMICFFNAFLYCTSGDVMSLRTMLSTFGFVLLGILKFDEKISFLTSTAFVIAVTGVILICHPSFIFDDDNSGISWIGFMFIIIGALFRVADKSSIKLSNFGDKTNQIHWLGLAIISYTISVCFGLFILVFSAIIVILNNLSNGNNITYNFDEYVWNSSNNLGASLTNSEASGIVIASGIFVFGRAVASTIGYQSGDLSKLGIIANADVFFAYLLQGLILNVREEWYIYFGACLIVIGSFLVFLDQIQSKKHLTQDESTPHGANYDNYNYSYKYNYNYSTGNYNFGLSPDDDEEEEYYYEGVGDGNDYKYTNDYNRLNDHNSGGINNNTHNNNNNNTNSIYNNNGNNIDVSDDSYDESMMVGGQQFHLNSQNVKGYQF